MNNQLSGAIGALLDEYNRAIQSLIAVIEPLSAEDLVAIRDKQTQDPDCQSIQSVLSHVVCSGYGYTIYIENHIGIAKPRLERVKLDSAAAYIEALNQMFAYCEAFFIAHPSLKLEEYANSKKIKVNWGQRYDIDQLMEHAIVHILRHRRQIERFIVQSRSLS